MLTRFRAAAFGVFAGAVLAAAPAGARVDDEPLPRFEDAVCPGVVGLKREAAEQVVGLIRGNVEALGRPVADENACVPNVIVAFVDDGQAFLANLERRNDELFYDMPRDEREAIVAETGPARAVLRIVPRTLTGMPIPRRENMTQLPQSLANAAHSRIYTGARRDIVSALVLIDRAAVRGLSLAQLADYATLRALTHTLPPPAARSGSIVGLFDGGAARPAGLTELDRAFLTTLYEGVPNLPGSAKLAALSRATGTAMPGEDY